jgi:hypothetical protein
MKKKDSVRAAKIYQARKPGSLRKEVDELRSAVRQLLTLLEAYTEDVDKALAELDKRIPKTATEVTGE